MNNLKKYFGLNLGWIIKAQMYRSQESIKYRARNNNSLSDWMEWYICFGYEEAISGDNDIFHIYILKEKYTQFHLTVRMKD